MDGTVLEVLSTLWQLVVLLATLAGELVLLVARNGLLVAFVAWWLLGVNWRKAWRYLADGAWVPVVLLLVVSALVWSRLAPGECDCLGFMKVPNFWWQLGYVGMLAAIALFCGWLQGVFGWTPAEVDLEPPADTGHGHHHGHH